MWNELVTLISAGEPSKDKSGYPIPAEGAKRDVLANKRSVRQSEFYAAGQNGLKADIRFEVHVFEYEGERILEHVGQRYEVVRTYEVSPEIIELTCSVASQKRKVKTYVRN